MNIICKRNKHGDIVNAYVYINYDKLKIVGIQRNGSLHQDNICISIYCPIRTKQDSLTANSTDTLFCFVAREGRKLYTILLHLGTM